MKTKLSRKKKKQLKKICDNIERIGTNLINKGYGKQVIEAL